MLPVADPDNIVRLGEGWTPIFKTDRLAATLPVKLNLYIKDEGQNPTQSFKARGMTAAISMAKELGVKKLAVPSAGNAAGALAAYAAKAGMEAFIFMPSDTPRANIVECRQTGANVTLVGLNLCEETLDGIRNHSWSRPAPATPEGEVVSWADRIAYVLRDFEDAVATGVVKAE